MTTEQYGDKIQREMLTASGQVSDSRRLVAFIYMMLLDQTPCRSVSVTLSEMMQAGAWSKDTVFTFQPETVDRANRLCDAPKDPLREFLQRLRYVLSEDVWMTLDGQVPLRDDIETIFSNGWVASYAKWVADMLNLDAQ